MFIAPISFNTYNIKPIRKSTYNNSAAGVSTPSYATNNVTFKQAMKTPIAAFIIDAAEKDMNRKERIVTTFLDVTESIATKLKDKGVSFNREYCERNALKDPKKYPSKMVRSGIMDIYDGMRTTLFCKNIYDLSILIDDILPEYKKRGYLLAKAPMKVEDLLKRGYVPEGKEALPIGGTVEMPDIDIRLRGAEKLADKLGKDIKFALGKPQSSGYEDIQMRFVREYDRKKNPDKIELIILMGQNYAEAKHIDSDKIYNFTRMFNELNVIKNNYPDEDIFRVKRFIDLIKSMFRNEASIKLFDNAKNKDVFEIEKEDPIKFSPQNIDLFEGYFSGLRGAIGKLYSEKLKNCKNEIRRKKLKKEKTSDYRMITNIQTNLRESIEYFNKQKTTKVVKPAKSAKTVATQQEPAKATTPKQENEKSKVL